MAPDGTLSVSEPCLLSVIIPLYRRTQWIAPCINALLAQDPGAPFEVVLVDDGSPNEQEVAEAVAGALNGCALTARFFRKENAGPAAARNFAVARSRGAILCFIDDDSVVSSGWLREIAESFRSDAGLSVVSGLIRSYDRVNPLPLLLEQAVYRGVHWATCNIAYRREVFLALGGFDERFRHASWEDNDLGLRARWGGYRQLHNEKAAVWHPHEETLDEYREKCRTNGRGAAAFSAKYLMRKPLWALAAPVIMCRHLVWLCAPSVVARKLSPAYVKFLWSRNSLSGFLEHLFTGKRLGKNHQG